MPRRNTQLIADIPCLYAQHPRQTGRRRQETARCAHSTRTFSLAERLDPAPVPIFHHLRARRQGGCRQRLGELLQLLESRPGELNESLTSALEHYGKTSGNSEIALTVVKSAIPAANSAFANTSWAVRQVANLADNGISAATPSAVHSTGAASQTRKNAA